MADYGTKNQNKLRKIEISLKAINTLQDNETRYLVGEFTCVFLTKHFFKAIENFAFYNEIGYIKLAVQNENTA